MKNDVDPLIVKTFDVSLILYAEHDFNASTFAARVTVSTLSDFYSGIISGIGTLRGPLHGGANEAAMEYLDPLNSI
jgi:2-methylcitrate synthase